MSLSKLITSVVKIADGITASLQSTVTYEAWIGDGTTFSEPLYDTAIEMQAIVEILDKQVRSESGDDILLKASVTFLRPIAPNGADSRREPVDVRDRITLPNGYTGPIRFVSGLDNPDINGMYMVEVILG